MATEEWISSDEEIWSYDFSDDFIWLPSLSTDYEFISVYGACDQEIGKNNSGILEHTYTDDNNKLILDELNTTPGFCYLFYHFDLPNKYANYYLHFKGTYTGSSSHEVKFQMYDWDATAFTDIFTLPTSTFTQSYYYNLPSGPQYFTQFYDGATLVSNNVILIRVIHTSEGNSGHLFRINYWKIAVGSI